MGAGITNLFRSVSLWDLAKESNKLCGVQIFQMCSLQFCTLHHWFQIQIHWPSESRNHTVGSVIRSTWLPHSTASSEGCRTIQFHLLCVTDENCSLWFVNISTVQHRSFLLCHKVTAVIDEYATQGSTGTFYCENLYKEEILSSVITNLGVRFLAIQFLPKQHCINQ